MTEADLNRLSLLQRLLHIQNLFLDMAIKSRQAFLRRIYRRGGDIKATCRRYYLKNKKWYQKYMKAYQEENKERIAEQHRAYRLAHREEFKMYNKRYRLKKKNQRSLK